MKILQTVICGVLALAFLNTGLPAKTETADKAAESTETVVALTESEEASPYIEAPYPPEITDTAGMSLKDFIRWVDFNVTAEVLGQAYEYDIKSYGQNPKLNWIELLAFAAAKNGNNFSRKKSPYVDEMAKKLREGKTVEELTANLKYYKYYYEAFTAVLTGYLGEYKTEAGETRYGLTVYYPVAKGYWVSGYDDFGNKRGYGFARRHLGNDLMGSVGTPIIAVEGGEVYEVGWNQYGGWRIGIMSADKKRYYYYAHLRKNKPYYKEFSKGDKIESGDILGFLGNTGYSTKENTNMKGKPHLHYGLQLIFDESQIDCNSEIWIDNYELLKFLGKSKMAVVKTEEGLSVKKQKIPLG